MTFISLYIHINDWKYYLSYSIVIYLALLTIDKLKCYFTCKKKFLKAVETSSFISGNFNEFKQNPEESLLKWAASNDICIIRFFHKRIILLNTYEQMQKFFCGYNGTIISNRPSSYFSKLVSRGYRGILFRHYGKDLEVLRQIMLEFFRDVNRTIWEDEINTKLLKLLDELKGQIGNVKCSNNVISSKAVVEDIKCHFEKYMVDLAAILLYGKSVDFAKLKGSILEGVIFNVRNTTMFNLITMLPIWHLVPNSLFNKLLNNTRATHAFTRELLNEYISEWNQRLNNEGIDNYKPCDLINALLYERFKDKTKQITINDDDIIVSVTTIFLSFFESISSTLAWVTFYLAKYPECQNKCRLEIETLLGQSHPSLADKNDFKYVNAFIKETFRMANIVPIILHVASQDIEIDEYYVKKGTAVIIFI